MVRFDLSPKAVSSNMKIAEMEKTTKPYPTSAKSRNSKAIPNFWARFALHSVEKPSSQPPFQVCAETC
jgi:hypothetical protein